MNDVLNVADAMLKIAKAKNEQLTPMQLMKLVYIAHGFSLALRDKELFHNQIEAWQYGPVIPDLYHATKSYGRNPIPLAGIGPSTQSPLNDNDMGLLQAVYNRYGHLNGIQLSYLTHQTGTPWEQVYKPNAQRIKIDNNRIRQHYKELSNAK